MIGSQTEDFEKGGEVVIPATSPHPIPLRFTPVVASGGGTAAMSPSARPDTTLYPAQQAALLSSLLRHLTLVVGSPEHHGSEAGSLTV
jgi:hypothetical protein